MKSSATTPKRRTHAVISEIKNWIIERKLAPGDRLPGEKELIEIFSVSKGTIREAMRILEAQGLTRTKTGPTGGCFVSEQSTTIASEVLGHYFYFQPTTMADVYQLRKILEPELAASAVPFIEQADIEQARNIMRDYSLPAQNRQEAFEQLVRSLDFYEVYVEKCPNEILSFYCQFLHTMLKKLTVIQLRETQMKQQEQLRRRGFDNQLQLLDAMRDKDALKTRQLIVEHMFFLHDYMEQNEAKINNRFL